MANALFVTARNRLIGADTYATAAIDLKVDTIKIALFDSAEATDPDPTSATQWNLGQPTAAGWNPATPWSAGATLGTKTYGSLAAGVFDALDTTFTALAGPDSCEFLVLYKSLTSDALSPMIAFWDSFTSGMPVTLNGGDVTVQWHTSGIFAI